MGDIVQKHYTLHHFRSQCGGEHAKHLSEDAILVPMFDVVWTAIAEALERREFSAFGVTDAMLLKHAGHFGRGQWLCVVDGLLLPMTPVFTDMNVTSGAPIYMVWNILVEGDTQRVNALLIKVSSFIRQYMATVTFPVVHEEAATLLRRHRSDLISRHVRSFYKVNGM